MGLELERRQARARAAMKAEQRIIREQQRAQRNEINDALAEYSRSLEKQLGMMLAEERQRTDDKIRAELTKQRAAESAEVIDLPPLQWKRHVA